MYLFVTGFEAGDIGYAAAIGWVLVLMLLGLSWVQFRITGLAREAS